MVRLTAHPTTLYGRTSLPAREVLRTPDSLHRVRLASLATVRRWCFVGRNPTSCASQYEVVRFAPGGQPDHPMRVDASGNDADRAHRRRRTSTVRADAGDV